MNNWANCMEVIVLWVGIKIACFESQSTITRMAMKPSEDGNCSMKSMEIEFQGFSGIRNCQRLPYGWCWDALELAQAIQDLQLSLTNEQTLDHV